MDDLTQAILIYAGLPVVAGLGTYIVKTLVLARLDTIEDMLPSKLNEAQVRQLLTDRIEPIREDIHDLKEKLDDIYSLLIRKS